MVTISGSARGKRHGTIGLRSMTLADGDECARIVYDAFAAIDDRHRFQRDFPISMPLAS